MDTASGNGYKPIDLDTVSTNNEFIAKGGDMNFITYDYYQQPEIRFQIIEQARLREIVVFNKEPGDTKHMVIRPLFMTRPSDRYMEWFCNRFDLQHNAQSLKVYASVFKLNWDITGLPPKTMKNLKQFRIEFNKQFEKAQVEADFVIDIDADKTAIAEGFSTPEEEFVKTKNWAKKLHAYMMDEHIPHFVNFSGGAGFNIRIPAAFLPPWKDWYEKAQKLAKHFAEKSGIPHGEREGIDTGVYDTRRIFKVPYTLSNCKVVLPVNTRELWDYTYNDYELVMVAKHQADAFYNHFQNHQKAEDESHLGDGIVYNYGRPGVENIQKIVKGL